MSTRGADVRGAAVPFAPKLNVRSEAGDPLDKAAQHTLDLLHRAAVAAEANNQQALEAVDKLSAQLCFSRVVASVTKDDAHEVVPIQLRSTVTRKARVPADQVNIKSDGGTLTLAESNKGLQWNYIGPRNSKSVPTAANRAGLAPPIVQPPP